MCSKKDMNIQKHDMENLFSGKWKAGLIKFRRHKPFSFIIFCSWHIDIFWMMRRAKAVVFVGTDVKGKTDQHLSWNHLIQLKKWTNIWK